MLAMDTEPAVPDPPGSVIMTPGQYFNNPGARAALDVAGAAMQTGFQQFGERVTQGYSSVGVYFHVNLKSVQNKLRTLLFPFNVKEWSRAPRGGADPLPTNNPNLPELYTPLVFSFVFLLEASVYMGVNGIFTFEKITILFIELFGYLVAAVCASKALFLMVGFPHSYPFLTLAADLGVISVYLSVDIFMSWSWFLRLVTLIYCGLAAALWTIRTLNPREGVQAVPPTPAQTYSMLSIALIQAIIPFLLVRKATISEPLSPKIPTHT
jgi:hypothetical protein